MKRFDVIKTLQLFLLAALTCTGLYVIFSDHALFASIASDSHVRAVAILLWLSLGVSFAFLFYDFNSYSDLKRENSELDNAIYSDALTGVANRYSVDVYISQFLNKPLPEDIGCLTIELASLGTINREEGHEAGDQAILDLAEVLQSCASGACFIGRNGGNKFLILFRDCSQKRLEEYIERLRSRLLDLNQKNSRKLVCKLGSAFAEGESVKTLTELIALSDRRSWQSETEYGL